LERLISSKLSTYIGRGIDRAQDYADVIELMKANRTPRDFGVDHNVRDEYHRVWGGLHEPKNVV
jgi:hypothetical protein